MMMAPTIPIGTDSPNAQSHTIDPGWGVVCFRKKRQCDAADEEDGCSSENRKQYRRKYARQSIDVVERHRSYR
jgi:hypothetical protein